MSPIQQMLLGVGAVATKTYVDDVFSTYLWAGSGSARSINNGVDMTEGGMTWIKKRSSSDRNVITDTVRGVTKQLFTERNDGESTDSDNITSFNNNGFSLDTDNRINQSGATYSSWSFRRASGFFDCVTFNETGSPHADFTVSHSLGCIPGMIILKRTDGSSDWWVWHKHDPTQLLRLNTTAAQLDMTNDWCIPTSTNFTFRPTYVGAMGAASWVAYLFAGGKGTTDKAVDFDGSGDYLSIPDSTAWDIGTDYTAECFFNIDSLTGAGWDAIFGQWPGNNNASTNTWTLEYVGTDLKFYYNDSSTTVQNKDLGTVSLGKWHHFAFSKQGSTTRLFIDGELKHSFTISLNAGNGSFNIGGNVAGGGYINGKVSNVRVTKDQALYTTNFNVPSDPLTTTSQGAIATNVKLLCCNGSTATASTVTPGTITANGDSTVTTNNSIFDDTAANVFGESGSESVIKCGSYTGNNDADGPEIYLGWEPQWVLVKTLASGNWRLLDSMRGIVTGGDDPELEPNSNSSEDAGNNRIAATPTGFKIDTASSSHNDNNGYIYVAIRRSDGYCGKPPELGTDVFSLARGAGNPSFPCFVTGFPVDFLLQREFASAASWITGARLTGTEYMYTNSTDAGAGTNYDWGSNTGAVLDRASSYQGWLWKRHAGFDVVCWEGDDTNAFRRHNLGKTPEMIIFKNRDDTRSWRVYHKGLNGGTNPEDYAVSINASSAEGSNTSYMNGTAPTSTHFVAGLDGDTNVSGDSYIAMLFASVDGICKVGSYTGSNSDQTITLGFQPRFLIVKAYNQSYSWLQLDTTRGWATSSGNNSKYLFLELNWAQNDIDVGYLTSTGFVAKGGSGNINESGASYIYYAHA